MCFKKKSLIHKLRQECTKRNEEIELDEVKNNVANVVGKGWENSKYVRLEYGQKRIEVLKKNGSTIEMPMAG